MFCHEPFSLSLSVMEAIVCKGFRGYDCQWQTRMSHVLSPFGDRDKSSFEGRAWVCTE